MLCTFAGHVTKHIEHVMDVADNAFPNAEEAIKEIDEKLKFNQGIFGQQHDLLNVYHPKHVVYVFL